MPTRQPQTDARAAAGSCAVADPPTAATGVALSGDRRRPVPPGPQRASRAVRIATLIAIITPPAALAVAIVLLWGAPFHGFYVGLLLAMYVLTGVGIGTGFHRLFTHRAFSAGPAVRLVLGVLGSIAAQGPLLAWAAVHRQHHRHTDEPGDPHSPHARHSPHTTEHDGERGGVVGVLKGAWHAHVGWLLPGMSPDVHRYAPDLLRDPVAVFISRTFAVWVLLGLAIPAVLGWLVVGTWPGALLGLLWGGLVRMGLIHHVTWSVNSACHLWGSRPFATTDQSRDNPIFGLLALGEGWHNGHHAFPASARSGLAWWKLDLNYLLIRTLAAVGLASRVRVPPPERVESRRR